MNNNKKRNVALSFEDAKKLYAQGDNFKTLALSAYTEKELTEKLLPKSWEELEKIRGCYIDETATVISNLTDYSTYVHSNKNVFAIKKQAKSALAMAQLSQLMKVYNDGWEPIWNDESVDKYCIYRFDNSIYIEPCTFTFHFLVFKTEEIAWEFRKNFEQLIKEYFMMD